MKHLATLLIWNRCPVLGVAAICCAKAQGWTLGISCAVFFGSLVASFIPLKREIVLSVLLGFTIGWLPAFAAMVPLVLLMLWIELQGRRMRQRLTLGESVG